MPNNDISDTDWQIVDGNEIPSSHNAAVPSRRTAYISFQVSLRAGGSMKSSSNAPRVIDAAKGNKLDSARPVAAQSDSRLLALPAEIRPHIYELLLKSRTFTDLGLHLRRGTPTDKPSVLTVLLTCRQIHFEAEKIFYQMNRPSCHDLPDFLASLGPVRREAITYLTIEAVQAASAYGGISQLHLLPNVRSIWIRRTQSIRFIQPSSWAIFTKQIVGKIERHEGLEEVKEERDGVREGLGLAVDAWVVGFVVGRMVCSLWRNIVVAALLPTQHHCSSGKATYANPVAKYSFGIRRFLLSKQTRVDDSITLKHTGAILYNANMDLQVDIHQSLLDLQGAFRPAHRRDGRILNHGDVFQYPLSCSSSVSYSLCTRHRRVCGSFHHDHGHNWKTRRSPFGYPRWSTCQLSPIKSRLPRPSERDSERGGINHLGETLDG